MSTSKTKSKGGKASQVTNGTSDHKNQPTAEQLRIARMAADKPDTDPEMMKKIKEVSDLTGRSADEAYTALHDCNGDANQAVDLLFEKDNHQDEWHEMKKKRKPAAANKAQADPAQNNQVAETKSTEKSENWESSEGQGESSGRGRRDRGMSRFGSRGTGRGSFKRAGRGAQNGTSNSRERIGAMDRGRDGMRGRRKGPATGRSGGRNFCDRDQSYEPAHQNIELWSNSIAENGKETESWNNNDEWANADDWDGSLEESLVLTRSVPPMSHPAAAMTCGDFAAPGHHLSQVQQPHYQMPDASGGQTHLSQHLPHQLQQVAQQQPGAYNLQDLVQQQTQAHHHIGQQQIKDGGLSSHGRTYGVMGSLGQGISDPYSSQAAHSSTTYLSHYAKEATECIKNAVGIGSNSTSGGNLGNASHSATPLLQQMDRSKPQPHLQQHMKPKVPVPSKIPQSAVEMPGSMGSMQLDVQFGNWDSPTNAGVSLNAQSIQNSAEMLQDKQAVNIQQLMSGGLASTGGSLNKHHMKNAHDNSSMHMKSTVEEIMTSGRGEDRRLQANVEASGTPAGPGGSGPGCGGGNEAAGNKVFATPEERKSHAFASQQPSAGYGQMQSTSSTQIEKSLLSSSFQQQDQQGTPLSQLGLSSSLGSSASTTNNQTPSVSTSGSGGRSSSVGYSAPNLPSSSAPSQHPHHHPNSQLQYPYNLVRGGEGPGNNGAYAYNHQFSSKNYGSDKQQSSLVFESPANTTNLYHHMQSSAYPGSSGMYLGGGSSYLPSSNVASFHNPGSGAYQTGGLGSSGNELSAQTPSSFHQHQHSNSSSNYPSSSLPGADSVFHNQSGHFFRNTAFRSPMEQESFQRDAGSANVGGVAQGGASVSSGVPMASGQNKLTSDLSKLGLKEVNASSAGGSVAGGSQFDTTSPMISVASLTTATNTTSSANLSTSVSSTTATGGTTKSSNSQLSLNTKSTTQTTSGKHVMNYQSNVNLLNTNYMISQPPGFQLAPFGYQHSQQALTGYAYEDMQAQRFNVGGASYYDVPFQMTNALQGRSDQQLSGQNPTFGGSDTKLTPLESAQPGGSLQPQQPATGSASQQFHHPYSGFNYYIPGTGLMPYIPVMPMSGMAVPMPTNPALQASVPSSQYQQKPGTVYGSHAFNMGGQSQDFTKGFNQSQTTLAKSASGGSSHGDMLLASGSGFNKQHVQGFDKGGFHGGTPPSSFGLNVPGGTQTGTPGAGPAVYSGPYMPVMGHPPHNQILHHTMVAQEMSLGNRGVTAGQQKVGPNKSYNTAYWPTGN